MDKPSFTDSDRQFSFAGAKALFITTKDGVTHPLGRPTINKLIKIDPKNVAFIKIYASSCKTDRVLNAARLISDFFDERVRIAPTKFSKAQHVYFVYPKDTQEMAEERSLFPRRSIPGLQLIPRATVAPGS